MTLFLKLRGDLLKIQLPKYLFTNTYSVELGGVWALVIFEIFPGNGNTWAESRSTAVNVNG